MQSGVKRRVKVTDWFPVATTISLCMSGTMGAVVKLEEGAAVVVMVLLVASVVKLVGPKAAKVVAVEKVVALDIDAAVFAVLFVVNPAGMASPRVSATGVSPRVSALTSSPITVVDITLIIINRANVTSLDGR